MKTQAKLVHFLIVEDEDAHAELIERSLRQNRVGNTFDRVADGEQALAYLRREGAFAQKQRPDVVLLDLKLPKVNGHEVLREIKSDDDLRSIPVVVLTTSGDESDKAKALYEHANSYVVKPLDFGRFHELVQELKLYWGVWNEQP